MPRDVFNGKNHSGFQWICTLPNWVRARCPCQHRHVHEEIVMIQTGQLDVTIEGKVTRVTPGSVVYVDSNEMHGWKNTGAPERSTS